MARFVRCTLAAAGAAALSIHVLLAQTPPQTGGPPPPPPCQVSADPQFALTPEHPMRVGGGPLSMAARERRYLESLRGPAGQPITFRRLGQARAAGKEGILDRWEVTYEGLEKAISIYLDAYYYADPKAPVGFTCVPFTLGPPPIDGFIATDLQVRLAIEQGSTRAFDPIPLASGGAPGRGGRRHSDVASGAGAYQRRAGGVRHAADRAVQIGRATPDPPESARRRHPTARRTGGPSDRRVRCPSASPIRA